MRRRLIVLILAAVAAPAVAQTDSLGGHWASPDPTPVSGAVTRAAFNPTQHTFRASFFGLDDVQGMFSHAGHVLQLQFGDASETLDYSVRVDTLSVFSLTGGRRIVEGPVLTLDRPGWGPVRLAWDPEMLLAAAASGARMGRMMAALADPVGDASEIRSGLLGAARRLARDAQRLAGIPPAFGGRALTDVTFAALGVDTDAGGGALSAYGTAYLRRENPCRGVPEIASARPPRLFVLAENRAHGIRACVAVAGPESDDLGEVVESVEAP